MGAGALHVERLGRAGPAVVLVHGFGQCAFSWRAVAPVLATAGYTVICVDLLGFGESDRPASAAYGLLAQAEYLERALTALRLGEVSVVGQDMGALVALGLAARHPRRVHRLALLEPLDADDLPGPAIRALQRTSALSALSANSLFGARPLLEPLLQDAVSDPDRMPERLVLRYLAPWIGRSGAAELLQMASAVTLTGDAMDESPLAGIELFAGNVLLWYGGAGIGAAASSRVALWRRRLPRAALAPLITARPPGMLISEDDPEGLTAALREWIA